MDLLKILKDVNTLSGVFRKFERYRVIQLTSRISSKSINLKSKEDFAIVNFLEIEGLIMMTDRTQQYVHPLKTNIYYYFEEIGEPTNSSQ